VSRALAWGWAGKEWRDVTPRRELGSSAAGGRLAHRVRFRSMSAAAQFVIHWKKTAAVKVRAGPYRRLGA